MKTQIKIVFAIALILVAFTSCFDGIIVEGNNEVTQETRSLPNFTEVSSSGSYHIYYQHGDSTKATIICESNILPYIETAVYNGRLDIKTAFHVSINPNKMIEIYVESPEIEEIELSGSGIIETDTVYGDELELDLSGSGDIRSIFFGNEFSSSISGSGSMDIYTECTTAKTSISGSGKILIEGAATNGDFNISGSGKIKAQDFELKNAEITISGSGDSYINASDLLEVDISGSGNIYYIGHPSIDINNSGSGRLVNDN